MFFYGGVEGGKASHRRSRMTHLFGVEIGHPETNIKKNELTVAGGTFWHRRRIINKIYLPLSLILYCFLGGYQNAGSEAGTEWANELFFLGGGRGRRESGCCQNGGGQEGRRAEQQG